MSGAESWDLAYLHEWQHQNMNLPSLYNQINNFCKKVKTKEPPAAADHEALAKE